MEAFAQVERDVLLLRCDGDPVALVITDLEPKFLGVPFRRPLRIGNDQGNRGEAHHGLGIRSPPIKPSGSPPTESSLSSARWTTALATTRRLRLPQARRAGRQKLSLAN